MSFSFSFFLISILNELWKGRPSVKISSFKDENLSQPPGGANGTEDKVSILVCGIPNSSNIIYRLVACK